MLRLLYYVFNNTSKYSIVFSIPSAIGIDTFRTRPKKVWGKSTCIESNNTVLFIFTVTKAENKYHSVTSKHFLFIGTNHLVPEITSEHVNPFLLEIKFQDTYTGCVIDFNWLITVQTITIITVTIIELNHNAMHSTSLPCNSSVLIRTPTPCQKIKYL